MARTFTEPPHQAGMFKSWPENIQDTGYRISARNTTGGPISGRACVRWSLWCREWNPEPTQARTVFCLSSILPNLRSSQRKEGGPEWGGWEEGCAETVGNRDTDFTVAKLVTGVLRLQSGLRSWWGATWTPETSPCSENHTPPLCTLPTHQIHS